MGRRARSMEESGQGKGEGRWEKEQGGGLSGIRILQAWGYCHVCNVGPENQVWGRIVTRMALQISIASSNAYKVPATDELLPLRHEFRP